MDYKSMVSDLIKGTNFEINSQSTVLSGSKLYVRTPIESINCLLGGGIPLACVVHTYGVPKGGKSTWLYQTMGEFQIMYPEGISIIVDQESSADPNRLRILGVDPERVLRLPATSVEGGFLALMKILENKEKNDRLKDVPVFCIWDTISKGLAQDGATQSRIKFSPLIA